MAKVRLDVLVQRLLDVSRSKARGLIETGNVRDASGEVLRKAGQLVEEDTALTITEGPRFVSRGGEKLDAAFEAFGLDVGGLATIDVGASTGGFTDCLLQRGARKVYAVDVGYGQLAWALRDDDRVVVLERTNIRDLNARQLDDKPSFFTVDCSFIGAGLVLAALKPLLARPCEGVVLVKPQFEVGREEVGKGGVVRSEEARRRAVEKVQAEAEALGFESGGVIRSPLLGPAGNEEFLLWLRLGD